MARLRTATAKYNRARAQTERARAEQRQAILDALAAGVRQSEVVAITGFTREHIRRITKGDDEA